MGHAANAAKYGMYVNHFYWMAAMPAMCFVGVFMTPFYYLNPAHYDHWKMVERPF
jgi:SSS family solute:Na+ symporter